MTELRATNKTDEVDFEESVVSVSEEGKVILDFVHIDGREHTVVLPKDGVMDLTAFIQDAITEAEQ